MEINKNSIIYTLIVVIILLFVYIIFQEQAVKIVTKVKYEPKVETVIEEKIIYLDRECKEKIVNKKEEIETIFKEKKEDIKEYIIASTLDASHRFKVSLFSYIEPLLVRDYKKVVLNGSLINDESQSVFIMDVNLAILENMNDVYFRVKDTQTEEVYIAQEACLYNLLENYIYKVDLEISGAEIICNVTEDRILEDDGKSMLMKTKVKENMKDVFLKMDFNGIRPSAE